MFREAILCGIFKEDRIIEILFRIGLSYEYKNNYAEALSSYQCALAIDPNNYKTYQFLGWLHFEHEKYKEAFENLSRATVLNNSDPDLIYMMGRLYLAQKQFDLANNSFQACLGKNPYNGVYHCSYGVMLCDQGKYQPAFESFTKAIRLSPKLQEAYIDIAAVYEIFNQFPDAVNVYERVLQINPDCLIASIRSTMLKRTLDRKAANVGATQDVPLRFFHPTVRVLINSSDLHNLLKTSVPQQYQPQPQSSFDNPNILQINNINIGQNSIQPIKIVNTATPAPVPSNDITQLLGNGPMQGFPQPPYMPPMPSMSNMFNPNQQVPYPGMMPQQQQVGNPLQSLFGMNGMNNPQMVMTRRLNPPIPGMGQVGGFPQQQMMLNGPGMMMPSQQEMAMMNANFQQQQQHQHQHQHQPPPQQPQQMPMSLSRIPMHPEQPSQRMAGPPSQPSTGFQATKQKSITVIKVPTKQTANPTPSPSTPQNSAQDNSRPRQESNETVPRGFSASRPIFPVPIIQPPKNSDANSDQKEK
eukprot:TRINITY_DN11105_c0_g1_i3.p1 TRINITY_DN11105_c0_g1~~TRINITY_DN11105_c0_g1_i3.p1  ORF type:complete len:527 (+),score=88.28 TRINITY_DN11105_c0_g1_i3:188-1768(+)